MKKLSIAAVLAFSAIASANPWVECGIGGAVGSLIEGNKNASKVIAVVSNIVWDLGTTATTSAVSTPDLCANKQVAAAKFINDTYASLEMETAKGEGANLNALLDLAEVNAAQRPQVIAALRAGLTSEISNPSFALLSKTQKAQGFYNILVATLS